MLPSWEQEGIQALHVTRLGRIFDRLDAAEVRDKVEPWYALHPLKGNLAGNWRLTFRFENGLANFVNYQDYH